MGDIQQDGLPPVLSVRQTASPYDDVHPQIPLRCEGFPALNLVRNPKSLQRAGDRVEKRLVLVHLRPGSGAMRDCRVSTSTASQQGHLTVTCSSIPMKSFPIPMNSDACAIRSQSVGRARRHVVVPAPCRFLYRALAQALVSVSSSGSSGPRGRAVFGSWSKDAL